MKNPDLAIVPNEPLSIKAARKLKEYVDENFRNGGRIPSEPKLAKMLKLNRSTVRQALTILEQEGVVIRKHGSGTYVNEHVLGVSMRLDSHMEYIKMIREAGFKPNSELIETSIETADNKTINKLKLGQNEDIHISRKRFFIDDAPSIYIIDRIPVRLFQSDISLIDFNQPVFDNLIEHCNCRIEYGISEVAATICEEWLANYLEYSVGQPVVYLNSLFFGCENEPTMYSTGYYNSNEVQMNIFRKTIY